MNMASKKTLVTGSAGFIGSTLCKKLLDRGDSVVGIDNHNNYYDPKIKDARLKRLTKYPNYKHYKLDLSDSHSLDEIFKKYKIQKVVNLAAQAGVRYSIENPLTYINSNIVGFAHILENCRHYQVEHLVYASTSSVYGANTTMPFSEHDSANHPLSVYAASKKSNELMAHTYSYLYQLPTTGLRFFTVYGPWGRPDMALFKFTKNILENKKIQLYNNGNHSRDFTYISDIVSGIFSILKKNNNTKNLFNTFNIGNGNSRKLKDYLKKIEKKLNKKAKITNLPLQLGDIKKTHSDISLLNKYSNYLPETDIEEGINNFIDWYLKYYKK